MTSTFFYVSVKYRKALKGEEKAIDLNALDIESRSGNVQGYFHN
jgi:hypothetical protein